VKRGNEVKRKKSGKFVWVRAGDNATYEPFDTPQEAGEWLGQITCDRKVAYREPQGVEIGPFKGLNYVSLFWGYKDADPVPNSAGGPALGARQRKEFERGLRSVKCED
jgi:hypothetical protein